MTAFATKVDIANSALQTVGADFITSLDTTVDTSKEAQQVSKCYDTLRRGELRRNVWGFSVCRAVLRALGGALPTWNSAITYAIGSLVTYGSVNYVSIHVTNLNQNPATQPTYWSVYTGITSQKLTFNAWVIGTTYLAGEIVTGSDSLIYLSLSSGNLGNDPITDIGDNWQLYSGNTVANAYDSGTTYSVGELVFDTANLAYFSTINGNANAPSTGTGWIVLACSVSAILMIPWPVGAGPGTDNGSRNIFVKPYGYLRQAPGDPRAGDYSVLGYPSNRMRDDWVFEGSFIVSRDAGPIVLRYAADVAQVSIMDDLFCEALANRIAYKICEPLTQSSTKLISIGQQYKFFVSEARTVNGIEQGSVNPPLDDYIAVRI